VLAPPHTVLKTSSGKIRRAASREYYEHGGTRVGPAPVWLQFVRLALGALLPELHRSLRAIASLLYAGYAWTVLFLLAVPVWILVAIARRPRIARTTCHWAAKLLVRLTGIRITVTGVENLPRTAHVLASNHASYVDFILLGVVLPPEHPYVFVAKREFTQQWIPRLFLEGVGAVFVERFDAQKGVEDVERVELAARSGASPVFFPEGTFDRQPGLREFRLGAFLVAAHVGVPVVPVGIRGARSILRDVSWFPRLGAAAIAVGAPIRPTGREWADAVALRDRVRAELLSLSGEAERLG
jgi:1-acyl-sn-glycerol-3-phosphate acyltransferase